MQHTANVTAGDPWTGMPLKKRHATLRKVAWTRIIRHRLVPKTYSPDAPTLQAYWRQRRARLHATAEGHAPLARRQQGLCPVCHQTLENGEALHIHHVVPQKQGGTVYPEICGSSSPLPSPNSQQQCASWSTSIA